MSKCRFVKIKVEVEVEATMMTRMGSREKRATKRDANKLDKENGKRETGNEMDP